MPHMKGQFIIIDALPVMNTAEASLMLVLVSALACVEGSRSIRHCRASTPSSDAQAALPFAP